jgi:hypothetical protein
MRVRFSDSEQWSSPVKPPRSQNYVKPHDARTRVHVAPAFPAFVPVSRMDEVLARAMMRKPEPIEWHETATTAAAVPDEAPVEEEASTLTAH